MVSTLGGFSTSGDIMMHVGEQAGKNLSITIANPDVLNIPDVLVISLDVLLISPWCTHDTPPDVLMIPPRCTHDIPRCTEHLPMYSWYPPHASWYPPMYSWYPPHASWYPPMYWTPPDVLMISPRCTHGIPPDVLMVSPRCTEHPLIYWTQIILKPSLLIDMNAKDNEIIYLIYDHASLSTCCFTDW